jgi:hypothetical protein
MLKGKATREVVEGICAAASSGGQPFVAAIGSKSFLISGNHWVEDGGHFDYYLNAEELTPQHAGYTNRKATADEQKLVDHVEWKA